MKGVISLPNGCQYKHDIFISYPHMPQANLVTAFVDALVKTLEFLRVADSFPVPVYLDKQRLQPGFRWHPALSKALCQSRCMIAVYTDVYFSREYCLREWTAMTELEMKRVGKRSNAKVTL